LRILLSSKGNEYISKSDNGSALVELAIIMREFMVDDESVVRQAACLAILERSNDNIALKLLRRSIVKCMRTSEDDEIHITLARGLMVATHLKPNIFVCKLSTPILEGALVLSISCLLSVKKCLMHLCG
jgi:hypothetical protein